MFKIFRIPVVMAMLFFITSSGFSQVPTMNDLKIQVDFNTSIYTEYTSTALQQDFLKGLDFGLKMWQSILPNMHYRIVTSGANFTVRFMEQKLCTYSTDPHTACYPGADFILVHPRPNTHEMQFGAFTSLSRDDALDKYEPATSPPYGYGDPKLDNGNGYTGGRFSHGGGDVSVNEGCDASLILFHEFGHYLGMYDNNDTRNGRIPLFYGRDFINAYGQPHSPMSSPGPNQPYITVPTIPPCVGGAYPTIPSIVVNGQNMYYGGGASIKTGGGCIYNQFERYSPWKSAFIKSNPCLVCKNTGTPDKLAPGIPGVTASACNNRVIYGMEVSPHLGPRDAGTWPLTYGIIRLVRADGLVSLANNWYSAIKYSQLLDPVQSNPYFVDSIYPECNNLKTIGAGAKFTAAIRTDGKVFAWGDNSYGQLGIGNKTTQLTPQQVSFSYGQFIRTVACGDYHMVMMDTLGELWACGNNANGQLGNNSTTTATKPVLVGDVAGKACDGNRYVAVAAGAAHCIALKEDGTIWTWGYNAYGQIGDNSVIDKKYPVQIGTANNWIAVYAGTQCSFAINTKSELYSWGRNNYGQLGLSTSSSMYKIPTKVYIGLNLWKCVSSSKNGHTLGIQTDGSLWGMGLNDKHQINPGASPQPPVQIGSAIDWVSCEAGLDFSCGKRRDNSIYGWGNKSIAVDKTRDVSSSAPVQLFNRNVDSDFPRCYKAGQTHMIVLTEKNQIYSWGSNDKGQLGTGNTTDQPVNTNNPQPISWKPSAIIISSVADFPGGTVSLTKEGTLDWATWGNPVTYDKPAEPGRRKLTGCFFSKFEILGYPGYIPGIPQSQVFSWNGDGPSTDTTNTSNTETQLSNVNGGISFLVSTSTAARRLKLYVGVNQDVGQLDLWIGLAGTHVTYTLTNMTGATYKVITIYFNAAGPLDGLWVNWIGTNGTYRAGHVKLLAATLY
jgi:alpha-tubulin suppressor-like RCC1 family protein